ncbi:max-binding protein MNT-like [Corythoichthys intestinalis]|uniref:max-binding protein MNT-like n=1 Tax=Corythoichthys intestinalis TaxID=161448 RepID=UPI0025A50A48|nr:max-binding protein MNT-like [Corythoichthys intestinalis]
MSIDTLLEAARYLEWQAERDRHVEPLQAEPRRLSCEEEPFKVKAFINKTEPTALQPMAANCTSSPPLQVPITLIPMAPVNTATPAPLPPASGPTRSPPRPPCPLQVKGDAAERSLPQVDLRYPPPVCGNGPVHPQPDPTSHVRTNGMTPDDARGGANSKRRPGGAGTREVHNKLEQNRRAHLKECFEKLKKNVPNVDDKKTSNLSVLRSALRYIQTLKRKEKEYEHEMERLAREKIATQQRLAELKKELSQRMDALEIERVIRQTVRPEDDQASTSTASEGEDNLEDAEEEAPAVPAPLPVSQATAVTRLPVWHAPPPVALPPAALPATGVIACTAAPRPPASHPSVIRAVSHAVPANHKHLPHIAPSPGPARPVGRIAVHPVARLAAPLPARLPALYPQGVPVPPPAVIAHTFAHHVQAAPQPGANVATTASQQQAAALGKPAAVLAPRPQLVGQASVTMVTVPTFPVGTLKLA